MRNRWIALTIGFVVLVAVVAVQHFAGGRPSAGSSTVASSQSSAPTTPPSTRRTSDRDASSTAPDHTMSDGPGIHVPLGSISAHLSQAVAEMSSVQQAAGGVRSTTAEDSVGHASSAPDTTSPTTSTAPTQAFPGAGNWELVGYGPAGVVRYRPSTGSVTVTPVPPVQSNNLLSFVVTSKAAIVRSMDNVDGYLVADGKPATPLAGLLQKGARVLPGPDSSRVWVVTETDPGASTGTAGIGGLAGPGQDPPRLTLTMVELNGKPTGSTIAIPYALLVAGGYGITSDQAGYALIYGIGGVYRLGPDGPRLVTHGGLLAVGPTRYLVYECDEIGRCGTAVVNRKDGSHRSLPELVSPAWLQSAEGVISPDGHVAALLQYDQAGTSLQLLDLTSGKFRSVDIQDGVITSVGSPLVFTPDGRYLLVGGTTGVTPVDVRTGDLLTPLPIPTVSALVVRSAPGT